MSFEEARVVCVVYLSVIIPIFVFLKNKSFLPRWVFPVYVISFLACAIGWELWFTYGWVDGAAVNLRRSDALNNWLPRDINWLMNSLGIQRSKNFFKMELESIQHFNDLVYWPKYLS